MKKPASIGSEGGNSLDAFVHVLHGVVFAFDRRADRILREEGSSFSKFLVLVAAAKHPGLSQRDIAQYLNITPAAVSRMVEMLVQEKLLVRTLDSESRRTHTVSLTAEGKRRFTHMHKLLYRDIHELLASVSDRDMQQSTHTLTRALEALDPGCAGCMRQTEQNYSI